MGHTASVGQHALYVVCIKHLLTGKTNEFIQNRLNCLGQILSALKVQKIIKLAIGSMARQKKKIINCVVREMEYQSAPTSLGRSLPFGQNE